MEERKIVNVYVTYDRRQYSQVGIPMDINEVELKALLRDLGYISSYRQAYFTTEVYLESDDKSELTEICLDKYRTLEELGIVEKCLIVIMRTDSLRWRCRFSAVFSACLAPSGSTRF